MIVLLPGFDTTTTAVSVTCSKRPVWFPPFASTTCTELPVACFTASHDVGGAACCAIAEFTSSAATTDTTRIHFAFRMAGRNTDVTSTRRRGDPLRPKQDAGQKQLRPRNSGPLRTEWGFVKVLAGDFC